MTSVRKAYSHAGCRHLHYRAVGPRQASKFPVLICLHAVPFSGRSFTTLLGHLGHDRQAIAPDLPGYGDSDPLPQVPDVAAYASAIGLLIDELGLEAVDLVGHRLGSVVALELALQRPEQVRKLILFSAPIFTAEEQAAFRQVTPTSTPREDGEHTAHSWQAFKEQSMDGWNLAAQFGDTLRRPSIAGWGDNALYQFALAERLAQVNQPIAAYNPDDEFNRATRRAEALVPNGFLSELSGWRLGFLDLHAGAIASMVREHTGGAER